MDTFEYKELTLADVIRLSEMCEHKEFICDGDSKEILVIDKENENE